MQRLLLTGFATAPTAVLPRAALTALTATRAAAGGTGGATTGAHTVTSSLSFSPSSSSAVVHRAVATSARCTASRRAPLPARVVVVGGGGARAASTFDAGAGRAADTAPTCARPHTSVPAPGAFRARAMATSAGAAGDDSSHPPDSVAGKLEVKLRDALAPALLQVVPAFDDPNGAHVSIRVVSDAFAGKRTVARHQMVYKAIWAEMQGSVHAVDSMVTQTPAEADTASSSS